MRINNRQQEIINKEEPNYYSDLKDSSVIDNIIINRFNSKASKKYNVVLGIAILLSAIGVYSIITTISQGLYLWNIDNKFSWGISIATFVFWIGIGHAGTLISAMLYLLNQSWRTSINRPSEAMTIIGLIVASIFPLIHTGRPWFAIYWLLPYPNQMGIWPNFKSPLVWDLFAIGIYFLVSVMFFYIGLLPDLSYMKLKVNSKKVGKLYTYLSLGWIGTATQWYNYKKLYILIAGLLAPLVISVHTIVSLDFSVTLLPGWHSAIFPPYFVAGAIYSGCAIVVVLSLAARNMLGLKDIITHRQINNLGKIMLSTGLIILLSYILEIIYVYFNSSKAEENLLIFRMTGEYAIYFWIMIIINVLLTQFLWFKRVRENILIMFILSVLISIGMWLERFVIVITSLSNDYFAMGTKSYFPSLTEIGMLIGSFGIFSLLYLIFIKIFPVVTLNEIKSELK